MQAVYIIPQHPFDEIDTFVTQTSQAYHLDLARYSAPMRTAFEAYLRDDPHHDPRQRRRRRRSEEGVKAVLVGTRRTDPNGAGLSAFDRTDGKWPDFMRVHPVIDWRYGEVWTVSNRQSDTRRDGAMLTIERDVSFYATSRSLIVPCTIEDIPRSEGRRILIRIRLCSFHPMPMVKERKGRDIDRLMSYRTITRNG